MKDNGTVRRTSAHAGCPQRMQLLGVLFLGALLASFSHGQNVPEAEQHLDAGAEILYSLMQVAESSMLTTQVPPPLPDLQIAEESRPVDIASSGEVDLIGMSKDYYQDLAATSDIPVNSEEVDPGSQETSIEREGNLEAEDNESAEYVNSEAVAEDAASSEVKTGAIENNAASIQVPFSTSSLVTQATTTFDQFKENQGRMLPKIPKLVTASKQLPPVRAPFIFPRPPSPPTFTKKPSQEPNTVSTVLHAAVSATDLDVRVAAHALEDMELMSTDPQQVSSQEYASSKFNPNSQEESAPNEYAEMTSSELHNPDEVKVSVHVESMEEATGEEATVSEASHIPEAKNNLATFPTTFHITPSNETKKVYFISSVQTSKSIEEGDSSAVMHSDSGEDYSEEEDPTTKISVATQISENARSSIVVHTTKTLTTGTFFLPNTTSAAENTLSTQSLLISKFTTSQPSTNFPLFYPTTKVPEMAKGSSSDTPNLKTTDLDTFNSNTNIPEIEVRTSVSQTVAPKIHTTSSEIKQNVQSKNPPSSYNETDKKNASFNWEEQPLSGIFYDRISGKFVTIPAPTQSTPATSTQTFVQSPSTTLATEKPVGKSLNIFSNSKTFPKGLRIQTEDPSILAKMLPPGLRIQTEDPNILAKMLPPSFLTTSLPTESTTSKSTKMEDKFAKVIFDKATGKNVTLRFFTEDPSILAAMTPPPSNTTSTLQSEPPDALTTAAQFRTIFNKALGKNITIKIQTEDESILAGMLPPSTTTKTTTSNVSTILNVSTTVTSSGENITVLTTEATTVDRMVRLGVPKQHGKLPIITRHNVTRKPFLPSRSPTKNPRPPPSFKRISDILNRSRVVTTKRPYYNHQSHEGHYQDDPDKRYTHQANVLPTTQRTTTTLSPYFRWGSSLVLSGNMKIIDGVDWVEEFREPTTNQFKKLANDIESQLFKLFKSSSVGGQFKGIQIEGFSKGLLVDYTVFMKDDTKGMVTKLLRETYREGLANGTYLGKLKVDPLYVDFRVVRQEEVHVSSTNEDESQGFPHWAIAIVGIGAASLLFLAVLLVIKAYNKRSVRRKYGSPLTDEILQERRKSMNAPSYDNPVPDGLYDMGEIWNENKPKQKYGSLNSNQRSSQHYGSSHERNIYDSNPYHTTDLFPRDFYQPTHHPPTHHPPKYQNSWNDWDEPSYARRSSSSYKQDYDTTF